MMALFIASIVITTVSIFVGVLIGIFLGRLANGLTDRWDGWAAQMDFLWWVINRGRQ